MPEAFYEHAELVEEAAGARRQPEFPPAPEVLTWRELVAQRKADAAEAKLQAIFDSISRIQTAIDTIDQ